ncbi:hypothetical protein SAMN06297129_0874 [Pseudooceanicola antarcticus]|uniref:Uncharacterized protein n=1 Tax=Pseudooceanicola antarcticus TaxID=1247613 RepID=A0A285I380_9RHOB|nr:hypothetical protein [Pseudooceanicola antarcticus]PJE30269.1 hypothetical protein CVM39_06030 [Pseudooceanicola antarcticus]SNY41526.1 hypothetical protein SAMN06297129_0874 [Pseudooceanicola antarcticus]
MDPILYRPLDVLDERIRRADPHQRHEARPHQPLKAPGPRRARLGWLNPRRWSRGPDGLLE